MSDSWKDILSKLPGDIDPETFMKYLNGQLPDDQRHEVEKILLQNDFASEAMEGLQSMKRKENISSIVDHLNYDLRKKLIKKNFRRKKLPLKNQPWIYISLLIILLLIVLGYYLIHKLSQPS